MAGNNKKPSEMTLYDMIDCLEALAKPVINDNRQDKYCEYITMLLSHFGRERCMVAGSTKENTRLRIRQNEGDYDYLIISEISIPAECLEYKKDLPSFVQINGIPIKDKFPEVELIDGKYLPSNLLSEIRPEAFKHIRNIYNIVSKLGSTRDRHHTLNIALDHRIKPGTSLVNYADPKWPGLQIQNRKAKKNSERIRQNIEHRLQDEPSEVKDMTIATIGKVSRALNAYDKLDPTHNHADTPESGFQQTYGSILDASDQSHVVSTEQSYEEKKNSNEDDSLSESKRPKLNVRLGIDSPDTGSTKTMASTPTLNTSTIMDIDGETSSCEENETRSEDKVVIQYSSKSSKDFIPAFPLCGKPKYLDDWRNRERISNWPPVNVIGEICNSEFFIVAKPAVDKSDKEKDFCLAYNNAEMQLAKAMTRVQKNVMLVIKALQMSILRQYSKELTTFHWKTALYWESESVDPSILENRTEDNIINFLQNVLVRMTRCLFDRELEHYFVPSNLFAGRREDQMHEIAANIAEIQEDPLDALRKFFIEQTSDELKFDMISREKVREFEEFYNDPGDSSLINTLVSLLRGFSTEDREVVKEAFKDVLTEGLTFFIEEESRGRDRNDIDLNNPLIQSLLASDFVRGTLTDSCVSLLMDQTNNDQGINEEEIARNFLSLVLHNVFSGSR